MDKTRSIRYLKGVGEKRATMFSALNLHTLGDLLYFLPRAYENRGDTCTVSEATDEAPCSLILKIDDTPLEKRARSGISYTTFSASDNTGSIDLVFYNQPWIAKSIKKGETYRFYGKVDRDLVSQSMSSPILERLQQGKSLRSIIPVYPLSKGLTQRIVSNAIAQIITLTEKEPNVLPKIIMSEYDLMPRGEAIYTLHNPKEMNELTRAKRSLAFEELLIYRLALNRLKNANYQIKARKMDYTGTKMPSFFESLPFELTKAQQRVLREVFSDLCKDTPMTRLIQGDVGSGKTVLAVAAIYFTAKNGFQSAMMAPTEILANQHYNSLTTLLTPFGISVVLLTGSMGKKKKSEVLTQLQDGTAKVVVGTHALIQIGVTYQALGLVVTDEQHRFGVLQRATLVEKGEEIRERPHTLVMSATPIPRTLSLILYGDLDVSILNEMPPGRQKISTYFVGSEYRQRVYAFIRKHLLKGQQAYIICSLVEENEDLPRRAVEEYAEDLQTNYFTDINIGFIHGRLSSKEKDRIMEEFLQNKIKILVSTTVIEVGVNVPNATVMLVENAESFGLSQLHQLRGRIGRGTQKSYCILMSDSKNEKTVQRLTTLTETSDGFEIAEADLKQRGPGDFFGERQSGALAFKYTDITDMNLLADTGLALGLIADNSDKMSDAEKQRLEQAIDEFFSKTMDGKTFN